MTRALMSRLSVEHVSVVRTGIGVAMLTRPATAPQLLGVDSAAAARMSWSTQMLGVREVALGLGTLVALRRGDARGTRVWLLAGLLSDTVDALVLTAATARGRVSRPAGVAGAALAGGAVLAQVEALQQDPDAVR
ncbi:MAG: DUF4267 domain-containing protein [Actinobacteria bacterium]|nr:DUF4267 domain-containing protein [Actinomycetota bacterium]MCA1719989.1 DUF4267 domain-containing protein [Actinomycetota bacterium]